MVIPVFFLRDVLVGTVEIDTSVENITQGSSSLFNFKVTTARQLRISKGGTMGRMTLSQRSYSDTPCFAEYAYEYIFQH